MQNYLNEIEKYKQIYPDYDERYDIGHYHMIFGVSCDGQESTVWSMNDLEIGYLRDKEEYMLSVETAYVFNNLLDEMKYLCRLLLVFDKYMDTNGFSKYTKPYIHMTQPGIEMKAKTIEELYMKFRMYVKGYCAVCYYVED